MADAIVLVNRRYRAIDQLYYGRQRGGRKKYPDISRERSNQPVALRLIWSAHPF